MDKTGQVARQGRRRIRDFGQKTVDWLRLKAEVYAMSACFNLVSRRIY